NAESHVLITGANRGLGLEMVRQLVEGPCTAQEIFAGCCSPEGPRSKALKDLVEKYPDIITVVPLVLTPTALKCLQRLQVGDKGLNVLVNNAGVLAHREMQDTSDNNMLCAFTTNVIGPVSVTKEYLPYLCVAARSSGEPAISCCKATCSNSTLVSKHIVQNMFLKLRLSDIGSASVSQAGLNMLTVCAALELKKDVVLCTAPMEAKQSVEGLLKVMSSLNEQHHGGFFDYAGNTVPW
uniref:Zgc:163083 n=1 Tax=Pygocentrus nattereri TaxID=42514 RepID=A0A3B4CDW2_PYGNA